MTYDHVIIDDNLDAKSLLHVSRCQGDEADIRFSKYISNYTSKYQLCSETLTFVWQKVRVVSIWLSEATAVTSLRRILC